MLFFRALAAFLFAGIVAAMPGIARAQAAPTTGVWLQGTSGDYIVGDQTIFAQAPVWTIRASGTASRFSLSMTDTGNGDNWNLVLAPGTGGGLASGAYEEAARAAFAGTSPGVEFYGNGRGCNTIAGRFAVLDATYNGDGSIATFAADFEQRCDGGAPLYGEVRFNSTVPFTFQRAAGWTHPDPFAFRARDGAVGGNLVVSNLATIYGIDAAAAIHVTNAEYRIDGGAWTSSDDTIANRSRVELRVIASATPGAVSTGTLDVGGVTAAFAVRTASPGDVQTVLYYKSSPGDYIGGGAIAEYPSSTSTIGASRNYDNGVSFSITTAGGGSWNLDLAAAGNATLLPGTYSGAARFPFQATTQPGLSFYGDGRGCNQVAGRFIVHEADYDTSGNVIRFAADFEQSCETFMPPLRGEIRFNSSVPLSRVLAVAAKRRVRDFDGNGRADLLWHGPSAQYGVWLMNGADLAAYAQVVDPGAGLDVTIVGDFDGDGHRDFIGRYPDGRVSAWFLDGTTVRTSAPLLGAGTGWRPVLAADFDGDLRSDLLWRSDSGTYAAWLMQAGTPVAYAILFDGAAGNLVTHAGDLDGDGRADLVGVGADGLVHVWKMSGTSVVGDTALASVGTGWTPVALADFSGDGRADLLLQHADGRFRLLIMNGAAVLTSLDIGSAGNGWTFVAAGDLDGDGRADLLLQHTDGRVAEWLMYGTQISASILAGAGTGWSVVGSDDYDGDGKADLLWRHQDGSYAIWLMNGLSPKSYKVILGAGSGWSVIP